MTLGTIVNVSHPLLLLKIIKVAKETANTSKSHCYMFQFAFGVLQATQERAEMHTVLYIK